MPKFSKVQVTCPTSKPSSRRCKASPDPYIFLGCKEAGISGLFFIYPAGVELSGYGVSGKYISLSRMFRSLTFGIFMLLLGSVASAQTEPVRPDAGIVAQRQIRSFPNPATTSIQFEFKQKVPLENTQLKIFNFLGKKVAEIPRLANSIRMDLSGFHRGIYIYQLTDARGRVLESGKFLVEKP
jgi:hypothetical protein